MDKDIFFAKFKHLAQGPGGTKKLRNLILQLAVQGKLIEQDPNDEPASVLLERVKNARQKLLDQKLIKKNKKFGLFPGDLNVPLLPKGWALTSLAELGTINPRNAVDDKSVAGFVPMPLISQYYGEHHTFEKNEWSQIKKGYTHFANGDVGLAKITPCFENSKCCVFSNLPNDVGAGTTELHIFRDDLGELNQYFIYMFLKSPWFLEDGKKHMTGSAGQKRVPVDYMAQKPFPLPPLAEQKRILAKVNELMALCDALEAQQDEYAALKRDCVASTLHHLTEAAEQTDINTNWSITENNFQNWFNDPKTVKTLRATILQLAVQGKLVPQELTDQNASDLLKVSKKEWKHLIDNTKVRRLKEPDSITAADELFDSPPNSAWCRYGDISVVSSGVTKGRKNIDRETITVPYLRVANVQRGWVDISVLKEIEIPVDELDKFSVKIGDVLQVEGGDWDKVGRAVVWAEDVRPCIHQNHIFKGRPLAGINPNYVELYMNAPTTMGYFQNCSKQTTNLASINKTQLNNTPFLLPSLGEQHRIVAKVNELMALCDQLEAQIGEQNQLTQDLTASLIHHMTAA